MHSFTVVTSVFPTGDGVSKVMQAAVPSITMWYTIRIMTTPLDELRLQLKTSATSSFDFGCGDKQWLLWLVKTGIFFFWMELPLSLCLYLTRILPVMAVRAIIHWSNWKSNKTEGYWTVWSIRSGTHTDTHSRATSKEKTVKKVPPNSLKKVRYIFHVTITVLYVTITILVF